MRKILTICALVAALCVGMVYSVRAAEPAEIIVHDWLGGSFGGEGGEGELAQRVIKEGDEFVYQYKASNETKEEIRLKWQVLDKLVYGDDPRWNVRGTLVIALKPGESKTLPFRSKKPPVLSFGLACMMQKTDVNDSKWQGIFGFTVTEGDSYMWVGHLCGTLEGHVPQTSLKRR